jgi:6-phosphogluconolactonase (cycloisomerase 2 family)
MNAKGKRLAEILFFLCLTIFSGCGGGSSSNVNLQSPPSSPPNNPPTPQAKDFLYQQVTSGIVVSPLDLSSGILGAPVDAASVLFLQPDLGMTPVSASGNFFYLTGFDTNPPVDGPSEGNPVEDIHCFSINQSDGSLIALPNSPFIASAHDSSLFLGPPNAMVVDQQGKFIYVSYFNGSIYSIRELAISQGTGELQDGDLVPSSAPWIAVQAIDPATKYLYASTVLSDRLAISVFAIDPGSGALQEIQRSPFTVLNTGSIQYNLNIFISGKFVYAIVINQTHGSPGVFVFSVDSATGVLTLVPGSPFSIGTLPVNAWVSPGGNFLYVLEATSVANVTAISVFPLDATTGAVATTPTSSVPVNDYFGNLLFDPQQKFLLFKNSDTTVLGFSIDGSTGALTAIPGSPFAIASDWLSSTIVRTQ